MSGRDHHLVWFRIIVVHRQYPEEGTNKHHGSDLTAALDLLEMIPSALLKGRSISLVPQHCCQ